MLGLKLTNLKAFEAELKRELAAQLTTKVNAAIPRIEARSKELIRTAIETSPTYLELANNGPLVGELGLEKPALQTLLAFWVDSVRVTLVQPKVTTRGISLKLKIAGVDTTGFRDSLALPEACYTTNKGEVIAWLAWLLIYGDREIIVNYYYSGNNPVDQQYSRTGQGIMRPSRTGKWHVPRQHSGNERNNFITRALAGLDNDIENILKQALS